MTLRILLSALLLGLTTPVLMAQQPPTHEKTTYRDTLNRFYVQTSLPLYLYVATQPTAGQMHELSQTNSNTTFNNIEPMYLDGDGEHHIQHFDTHEHKPVIFALYADSKAPTTVATFANSPLYRTDSTIIYGQNLTVNLATTDEISGVKQTYYALNGADYLPYSQTLQLNKEAENTLQFMAIDHVGNVAEVSERKFIIDRTAPRTYYNVTGISRQDSTNILSTTSVVYLEPTDNIAGIAQSYYWFDNETEKKYNNKSITFAYLSEGEHTLHYYSVDKVENKEAAQHFYFFLDKSAPIVATDVLGDRFIVNNQVYFSGRSKLKITAVDNKIGVKDVKFSVNSTEFSNYTEPFYLPSRPGMHVIRYYAVDSLENATLGDKDLNNLEYRHNVSKVYVDLTGPSLSYKYVGQTFTSRDTVFINTATRISLSYSDLESGPQKLAYTLDNDPTEIPFTENIAVQQSGFHAISAIGYDNVNNRNFKTFSFVVDGTPPQITTKYSVEPIGQLLDIPIYPPFVVLFVAPTDDLTGIDKIFYSVNNQVEKEYTGRIEGFAKGEKNEITIRVIDKLSNESKVQLQFYTLEK